MNKRKIMAKIIEKILLKRGSMTFNIVALFQNTKRHKLNLIATCDYDL